MEKRGGGMRYKAGDVVRVKSRDWYERKRDPDGWIDPEGSLGLFGLVKAEYCGKLMKVRLVINARGAQIYKCDDAPGCLWEDWMLEDTIIENVKECPL
jgi:hypothetical protein